MGGRDDLAHVVVDGWGPLAEELTAQLRRCLVEVRGGAHAADGAEIALDADAVPPAVVVGRRQGRTPGWAGAPWQARGIPHLPLVLADRTVVVGPLVVPGPHGLPAVCPAGRGRARTSAGPDTPGGGLVLAAAVATVTVLAVLRGDHSLGGISTEIGLDEVAVTHRLWRPRPGCGCSRVRMAG